MRPMPAPVDVSSAVNPGSALLEPGFVVKFRMFNVDPGVQYGHLEAMTCTGNVCVNEGLESIHPIICLGTSGNECQLLVGNKGNGPKGQCDLVKAQEREEDGNTRTIL